MGLFSRKPKPRYVNVSFRDLTSTQPADPEHGYVYLWPFPTPPAVGMWVRVTGIDGKPASVLIGAIDVKPPTGYTIAPVRGIISEQEIRDAFAKKEADHGAWLDMARRAAGLPSKTRRAKPPAGFPAIAPIDGQASAQDAGDYGSMWWRVFKEAEAQGWPRDEVQRVQSIARRWYAVRDKGGN